MKSGKNTNLVHNVYMHAKNEKHPNDGGGATNDTKIQVHRAVATATAYSFKCDKKIEVPHTRGT